MGLLLCDNNLIEEFDGFDLFKYNLRRFRILHNPIKSFYGLTKHALKTLLIPISLYGTNESFNLSKTGQKLLTDLLDDNYYSDFLSYLFENIPLNEDETEEEKFYPEEKFEKFYNFYKKHTDEILQNLISEKSVSLEEMERLVHEDGLNHRHLLENVLPKDHPIFEMFNEKFSIGCESGLKILI